MSMTQKLGAQALVVEAPPCGCGAKGPAMMTCSGTPPRQAQYNLTVARQKLAEFAGVTLDARLHASNHGVTGRFDARRELPNHADLSYSIENQEGIYDLASAKHVVRVGLPLAGGDAALSVESEAANQRYMGSYTRDIQGGKAGFRVSMKDEALGYNVSYARDVGDLLPVDANVHLGVDVAGAYSKFVVHHDLGSGFDAEYEARARVGLGDYRAQQFAHALKVANKQGFAQLVPGTGQAPVAGWL